MLKSAKQPEKGGSDMLLVVGFNGTLCDNSKHSRQRVSFIEKFQDEFGSMKKNKNGRELRTNI